MKSNPVSSCYFAAYADVSRTDPVFFTIGGYAGPKAPGGDAAAPTGIGPIPLILSFLKTVYSYIFDILRIWETFPGLVSWPDPIFALIFLTFPGYRFPARLLFPPFFEK